MENLRVYEDALLKAAQRLQEQAHSLQMMSDQIQLVRAKLSFQVKQRDNINRRLAILSNSLSENAHNLYRCADCLQQAVSQYKSCEKRLMDVDDGGSAFSYKE